MTGELARLDVRDLAGVFAARQFGRKLAAGLDLEPQDQIRVATAVSEIGRSAVTAGRGAVLAFGFDDFDLVLTATFDGEPPDEGIAAASPADGQGGDRREGCPDDEAAATGRPA